MDEDAMDDHLFNQNGDTLEDFVAVYLCYYQDAGWEEDFFKISVLERIR